MTSAFLAVCGHTNIDIILEVKALPKAGESQPVRRRRVVWGGTAANIARHAGALGVGVRLWSRVGTDFPADWRAALEGDGVDLRFLDVAPDALTPTCTILTDQDHEQAFCMDEGPMGEMAAHPPAHGLLEGLAGPDGPGWLHVGTGDPKAYHDLIDQARQQGLRVAFDPGQELRFQYDTKAFERVLDRSDVFFCNRHELDLALRFLGYGDPVQLLDHVPVVVTTRGGDGASLYREGRKPVHAPGFATDAVDPTGAGDAMRAGWYAALADGLDMDEALQWGQAAGAVAVRHAGPQTYPVRRRDLDAMLG